LGTTKQVLSRLSLFRKQGYVTTVPCQNDKRAVNIAVTEAARKPEWNARKNRWCYLPNFLKNLPHTRIETLWNLLKKLYRFDGEEQMI